MASTLWHKTKRVSSLNGLGCGCNSMALGCAECGGTCGGNKVSGFGCGGSCGGNCGCNKGMNGLGETLLTETEWATQQGLSLPQQNGSGYVLFTTAEYAQFPAGIFLNSECPACGPTGYNGQTAMKARPRDLLIATFDPWAQWKSIYGTSDKVPSPAVRVDLELRCKEGDRYDDSVTSSSGTKTMRIGRQGSDGLYWIEGITRYKNFDLPVPLVFRVIGPFNSGKAAAYWTWEVATSDLPAFESGKNLTPRMYLRMWSYPGSVSGKPGYIEGMYLPDGSLQTINGFENPAAAKASQIMDFVPEYENYKACVVDGGGTPPKDPVSPVIDIPELWLLPCSESTKATDLVYNHTSGGGVSVFRNLGTRGIYKLTFLPTANGNLYLRGVMGPFNLPNAYPTYYDLRENGFVWSVRFLETEPSAVRELQWRDTGELYSNQIINVGASPVLYQKGADYKKDNQAPLAKPCVTPSPPPQPPVIDPELLRFLSLPPCSPETQSDRVHGPSDYSGGATYIIRETSVGTFWIEIASNGTTTQIGPYKSGARVQFKRTALANGQVYQIQWLNLDGKVETWEQPFGGGAMKLIRLDSEPIGREYEGLPDRLEEIAPEWRGCVEPEKKTDPNPRNPAGAAVASYIPATTDNTGCPKPDIYIELDPELCNC